MSLLQRGETFIHQRKFREDGTPIDVDTASMKITFPCSGGTADIAMTKITTGVYQGIWDIPADAVFGEYLVEVTTVTGTTTSKFVDSFYVLPWNITQQIRSTSGIKQCNDIDDDDIAIIAWNAYLEAKEDCFKYVTEEGVQVDGYHNRDSSNKAFYARYLHLVAGHTVCDEVAIKGYYLTEAKEIENLTISITDADKGLLSIADKNGDALTGTESCVNYNYRIQSSAFKEQLFKKAIVYLASHEIVLRFNELDKATLADLQSNSPLILANPNRMEKKYKQVIRKIKLIEVDSV